jgi:hypothetical protein
MPFYEIIKIGISRSPPRIGPRVGSIFKYLIFKDLLQKGLFMPGSLKKNEKMSIFNL